MRGSHACASSTCLDRWAGGRGVQAWTQGNNNGTCTGAALKWLATARARLQPNVAPLEDVTWLSGNCGPHPVPVHKHAYMHTHRIRTHAHTHAHTDFPQRPCSGSPMPARCSMCAPALWCRVRGLRARSCTCGASSTTWQTASSAGWRGLSVLRARWMRHW